MQMKTSLSTHRVNPAAERIVLGPLIIDFLLTRGTSGGSIAAFELTVPGGERLMAPAHSHDHRSECDRLRELAQRDVAGRQDDGAREPGASGVVRGK